jgi:hypothetical protein
MALLNRGDTFFCTIGRESSFWDGMPFKLFERRGYPERSPDYKKTIGFTLAALASLPSVRYNDPPDLVEERF